MVGFDKSTDVAVLKVRRAGRRPHPLPLGNSSNVQVGDPVVAIGNPLGEDRTVTPGIVSAVQRDISSLEPVSRSTGAIQTDAAINHGNSGGPLINNHGQVIGINSQILSDDPSNPESGSIGIGFAIPINPAKNVARRSSATASRAHLPRHPRLGADAGPRQGAQPERRTTACWSARSSPTRRPPRPG